jgi:peptidoglycan/LPS O-acetylase OafA/YrhL
VFDALPLATYSALGFYAVLVAMCFPWFRKAFNVYSQDGNRHALKGFDFFRGFAAAYVALGHGYWFSNPLMNQTGVIWPGLIWASKGVGIFAVLSGFLIYRSVAAINTWNGLKNYFVKRFFRIYPLYFVSVLICALFAQYIIPRGEFNCKYFFEDLFMLRFFPISQGANPVYWTLYVEVLFYLALPAIILGLRKRMIVPACVIILAALLFIDQGDRYLGLVKYFAFGVMAAELSPRLKRFSLPIFIAGLAICFFDFGGPAHDFFGKWHIGCRHPFLDTFGLGLGCAMVAIGLPHLPRISKVLDLFPLRFLGTISYSVYLTHMIFLVALFPSLGVLRFCKIPCAQALQMAPLSASYLPLVFLPAVLFWSFVLYMLVERPGILLGRFLISRNKKKEEFGKPTRLEEVPAPVPV